MDVEWVSWVWIKFLPLVLLQFLEQREKAWFGAKCIGNVFSFFLLFSGFCFFGITFSRSTD